MFTVITRERTADGATMTTVSINWKPVILIAIALLVVGGMIGYLVSSRSGGETIRISAEEQARNERVLQGKATQEDLRQIEREAKEDEKEILRAIGQPAPTAKPAPTATPAAATTAGVPKWALGGSWTKTFETANGPFTIRYAQTSSDKGKVLVWFELNESRLLDRAILDISDKPISVRWTFIEKNIKGEIEGKSTITKFLKPGEIEKDYAGFGPTWAEPGIITMGETLVEVQ